MQILSFSPILSMFYSKMLDTLDDKHMGGDFLKAKKKNIGVSRPSLLCLCK